MNSDSAKLTPMMEQYLRAKAEIPKDAVLFFRLGDFYEMFFEDAQRAAPVLELVLTKRAGTPMCGVPYRTVETYIQKLLDAGIKVAIAEQMEDPALAKGIVKREVTRLITPGTILDSAFLSPGVNNFLCALCGAEDGPFGLSWLDISTAEFQTEELPDRRTLESELQRLQPKECLLPATLQERWNREKTFPVISRPILWTSLDDWIFSMENAGETLRRQLGAMSLDGFGLRDRPNAVRASGAVFHYAAENLRQNTGHIRVLQYHIPGDYLGLDPVCQRNLELVESLHGNGREGTLLQLLDRTCTAMGSRRMRNWILNPLCSSDPIIERQDVVAAFHDDVLSRTELRECLSAVRDLERLTAKLNAGNSNARDLQALAQSIGVFPGLRAILNLYDLPLVQVLRDRIAELPQLAERITSSLSDDPPAVITDGGLFRAGFNAELDELRLASTEGKHWVARLQSQEQERTGIKSLKVHFNKIFGYYIEISKSNLEHVPEDYMRKQTLANSERFITPELKEMESKILGSEDKAKALELQLFEELRAFAATFTALIQASARAVADLDALASLAEVSAKYRYCRPHIQDDDTLRILGGRHPVLDAKMEGERFVPNDTVLDGQSNRMMIITGPNMAGKSTYIRQTALLVILAQMGSFIPAEEAWIGLADRIFTRVGAMDDLARGQSTFMVEMVETANILNHATAKSLVILDEIGRGTSTFDGLSIAWAVAEFLLDHPACRARTQFATHYHELTELALTRSGVKNYNVAVREYGDQIIFLRRIVPGAADKSYGIHVAKLAGLPDEVIVRAKEILENLEANAIADAGQPALTQAVRERKVNYRTRLSPAEDPNAPMQPGLFD